MAREMGLDISQANVSLFITSTSVQEKQQSFCQLGEQ